MTECQSATTAPETTAGVLTSLITNLPTVDELYPLWRRPSGKRGGLTREERAAKKENAEKRAAYQATLDGLQTQTDQVATLEHNADVREKYILECEESLRGAETRERLTLANFRLCQRATLQIARMTKDELEPVPYDQWGLDVRFVNRLATYELHFGHAPGVTVTPRDKSRAPLTLSLDTEGLTVHSVLMLQAHLSLGANALTRRARSVLRRSQPKSKSKKSKSTTPKNNVFFVTGTSIGRCSDPGCALYGG